MKTTSLTLTDDQYDTLWETLHRTRSTSKSVTVDKQALANILVDHTRMWSDLFPSVPSIQKKMP